MGLFNLNLEGAAGEDVVLSVYDAQARLVWTNTLSQAWGSVLSTIDLSGMATGVYQLELVANGSRQTVQLMKQ